MVKFEPLGGLHESAEAAEQGSRAAGWLVFARRRPSLPAFAESKPVAMQLPHSTHASRRLRLILGLLSAATSQQDMALPGLSLHPLTGGRKGTWDADAVDYEDYH